MDYNPNTPLFRPLTAGDVSDYRSFREHVRRGLGTTWDKTQVACPCGGHFWAARFGTVLDMDPVTGEDDTYKQKRTKPESGL
jgi:hypothetical protein